MMLYYENIPSIVVGTVNSLYEGFSAESQAAAVAQIFKSPSATSFLADATLLVSQVAFVVSVLAGAFIVFIAIQRRALKASAASSPAAEAASETPPPVPTGVLRDRWNGILAYLDSTREADWKLAVIEADTLVDDALARAGFAGATFGDRLSNIRPEALLSLDGVWWAHKVRNRLAHEVDYFLRYTEARQAVGYFESALSELKLI